MVDSNMNDSDSTKKNLYEERKAASIVLLNLISDFEEQLYTIKIQLKSHKTLLQEKEQELKEKEKSKLDLFSSLYNKAQDTAELSLIIEQLKKRIDSLKVDQEKLLEKIAGLKTAAQCVDHYLNESNNVSDGNSKVKFNDKGLSNLEAQEIERQRIARELHDTTVQNLTSMVHKSELCVKLIDIDSIRAKLELKAMGNTLKSIINELRGIIYNLKPMTLDDLGLTITVQRYANRIMDLNNIFVKVQANQETSNILPVIKLTLFRIIQEACNNALKHANATEIDINITYDEHKVKVEIADNGTGFNMEGLPPATSEHTSSFGLSNMRERTSLLSGSLDIKTEKGKGTVITVIVPLTSYEEDKNG